MVKFLFAPGDSGVAGLALQRLASETSPRLSQHLSRGAVSAIFAPLPALLLSSTPRSFAVVFSGALSLAL